MPVFFTTSPMRSRLPSMASGEAWWSSRVVVPARMARAMGMIAESSTSSRVSARSSFHHRFCRISTKLALGLGARPQAKVE
jgi:hypothetical protein